MNQYPALKSIILVIVFTVFCQPSFAQQTKYDKIIREFIQNVKENNVEAIAENIQYPFYREYPIPPINSEEEFIRRYSQIFDDSLRQLIVRSNIHKDWDAMGWRGIMLINGVLWLNYGRGLLSVNYQSDFEKKLWERIVKKMKSKLYPSLREFKEPVLFMITKSFKIRIDYLGNSKYRYASWSVDETQSDEPDLVLTSDKIEYMEAEEHIAISSKMETIPISVIL